MRPAIYVRRDTPDLEEPLKGLETAGWERYGIITLKDTSGKEFEVTVMLKKSEMKVICDQAKVCAHRITCGGAVPHEPDPNECGKCPMNKDAKCKEEQAALIDVKESSMDF